MLFFYFYFKTIHILQPHISQFLYFIHIVTTLCMIYTIPCWHTPNLCSCMNIIITKNEWSEVKICRIDSTLTLICVILSNWVLSIIWQACYKLHKICFLYAFYRPSEKTSKVWCFAPAFPFYITFTDGLSIWSYSFPYWTYIYNNIFKYNKKNLSSY